MTPDTRKTLLRLVDEYGNCLTRIQAEKDLMKCIEARAVTECGMATKVFKPVATAYWKDQVRQVSEELDAQMAAFELVHDMKQAAFDLIRTEVEVEEAIA